MRSQDLRLAVHSLWSNLDLTVSLLGKVAEDDALAGEARREAGRVRDELAALVGETEAGERRARLVEAEAALVALEAGVNGPLPTGKS